MASHDPKIDGVSIILIGSFNPSIFQPAWFGAQKLLRTQESESANIEVIVSEIVSFSTDWLKVQVTRERFSASTIQQHAYEPLRDLVAETFKLLGHTPISGMGLNWDGHFQVASNDAWHAFGHRLAPKQPWVDLLAGPGLLSLSMIGKRPDAHTGHVVVRVEASNQVEPHGVYISVNDHFDGLADAQGRIGCEKLVGILESEWSASISRSKHIAAKLVEGA